MAKQDASPELKRDEFSKIFDEYRAKIEEITRRSEKNFQINPVAPPAPAEEDEHIEVVSASNAPAAETAESVQPAAESEPAPAAEPGREQVTPEMIEDVRQQSRPSMSLPELKTGAPIDKSNGKKPAQEESPEVIKKARREAQRIIDEAEETVKKEAKKKTQAQVEKILEKARKEAEEIVEQANKNAEKVRDDVIAESKREADLIIREITQKYRQETESKASHAMTEAREKADKLLADVSATTAEVSKHITEIIHKARQTTSELETSLQAEINELLQIIGETRNKLDEAGTITQDEQYPPPPAPKQLEEIDNKPTLAIRFHGEKTNRGSGPLFSGQMEMKSASASFDYQYLKKLKKHLMYVPRIKYRQEYASEKEMSVLFDILEPLPMMDVLSNIPMVEKIITRADDEILLIFKTLE